MIKNPIFMLILLTGATKASGQSFLNPDLNGIITGSAALPTDWQNVPFTDTNCLANTAARATPDLTDLFGPDTSLGVAGNPYSGNTFVSGGRSTYLTDVFDEGIMQTVTGFIPNNSYTIRFQQAVVKQINCLDRSGSWAVYIDNDLAGITLPTLSNAPYNSTSFIWEARSITFTATAISHTIKFLPRDDDLNVEISPSDTLGALRMGIDSIYMASCSLPPFNLGNDTTLCQGEILPLNVTTNNATYVWQDNSTDPTLSVSQSGSYSVQISIGGCVASDTVNVSFTPLPNVFIGNDTSICMGRSLLLDVGNQGGSFLWQDGSTNSTFNAAQAGTYWVVYTDQFCSLSDTIMISTIALPNAELGNDAELCDGETLTLTPNSNGATLLWSDMSTGSSLLVQQSGQYAVLVSNTCGTAADSILVSYKDCSCLLFVPNAFTPQSDGINEAFRPVHDCEFESYHLQIFNRWGELQFEADNVTMQWEGTYKGRFVPDGVYIYVIEYTSRAQSAERLVGHVSVLR